MSKGEALSCHQDKWPSVGSRFSISDITLFSFSLRRLTCHYTWRQNVFWLIRLDLHAPEWHWGWIGIWLAKQHTEEVVWDTLWLHWRQVLMQLCCKSTYNNYVAKKIHNKVQLLQTSKVAARQPLISKHTKQLFPQYSAVDVIQAHLAKL